MRTAYQITQKIEGNEIFCLPLAQEDSSWQIRFFQVTVWCWLQLRSWKAPQQSPRVTHIYPLTLIKLLASLYKNPCRSVVMVIQIDQPCLETSSAVIHTINCKCTLIIPRSMQNNTLSDTSWRNLKNTVCVWVPACVHIYLVRLGPLNISCIRSAAYAHVGCCRAFSAVFLLLFFLQPVSKQISSVCSPLFLSFCELSPQLLFLSSFSFLSVVIVITQKSK